MRPTENDTYRDRVKQHTNNKAIKLQRIQTGLKSIHRHMVHTQLNKDSKQLCTPPPKIEEQTLP